MRSYRAFGKETDTFEYFMKGKWRRFASLPKPVDPSLSSWADDKILLKRALVRAGIPVPRGESFFFLASALRFARTLSFPVILKPRLGSRGRHTTTMIQTLEELVSAFHRAKQLCGWVVLEEHLTGPVYRATVVDGKVVGVLGGTPPRITGDGISSIRDLIARKNETRPDGVGVYPITPLTDVFLLRQGLTVDSVLQKDRTIDLTEKIGVRVGGTSFEATDTHPAIISVMEAAARVVGDPLIGFDFIIDRLDEDPSGKRWGIIECNTMPFINLHHDPLYGPSNNVAGKVWDLMERRV
jgi:D-alanine-D-alanine ligase-like ATP-grasp enzyme